MTIADKVCRIRPGSGLVGRLAGVAFLISAPGSEVGGEVLAAIRKAAEDSAGGKRLARQLAWVLAGTDAEIPGFGLVADDPDGTVVFVHGQVAVTAQIGDSEMKVSGVETATWVDRVVAEGVGNVSVTRLDVPVEAADGHTELREGLVTGSGLSLIGAEAAAAKPDGATVVDVLPPPLRQEPVSTDDREAADRRDEAGGAERGAEDEEATSGHAVVDLAEAPDERREPLPLAADAAAAGADMVLGVKCSRGHFNEPNALHCAQCGIAMVHLTKVRVLGPRPALGFLILDDGTTYTLDAPYIVGRQPDRDDQVVAGHARPLVVDDPDLYVSRVHAVVDLQGWDIVITDRSSHGTYVWAPGDATWTRLDPGQSFKLRSGTHVQLGGAGGESGRRFTVDAPHHR